MGLHNFCDVGAVACSDLLDGPSGANENGAYVNNRLYYVALC